jgi:hypothetical protein
MIQGHSLPLSEPVAQLLGFAAGLLSYAVAGFATHDHNTRLWAALLASMLTNVVIGAKINLALLDLLSAVIVRPISAGVGAAALALLLNSVHG